MSSDMENASNVDFVSVSEVDWQHSFSRRLRELHKFYCSEFGSEPKFYVRVPGRVNLIGEHVDYCGYPVLPMAIDQCILLAVGHSEANTFLHLRNVENEKFDNLKCDLNAIKIDLPEKGGPEWYKYYLCGVMGIYETLGNVVRPIGMTVALSGNIPPASGLSSSSALVSAAVLATAYVHQMPLDRKRLASISARCERYIGTQGGGMDQAIAYLAKTGCAQFIEFYPELNATPIKLPQGACFIVANSLAEINKAASSDFNERVVECRLAARIIAKCMKISNWHDITRFAQLQEILNLNLVRLEELAMKFLPKDTYTRSELCEELQVDEQEFENEFLTANTRHMMKFKLRQRTLHVVQESLRVRKFCNICEQIKNASSNCSNGETNGNCEKDDEVDDSLALTTLSQLMRQSHRSLKDLYECSHPDLDRLIELSDASGVGARLTGAGWGGCIVALCDSIETSAKYMKELKSKYFSQLPAHILEAHQHNDFADVIFATFPGNGAEIFTAASTTISAPS